MQEKIESTGSATVQVESNSPEVEEDLSSVSEEELNSADIVQPADYPELQVLQKVIDLEKVDGYLVTDNPGTRVVIFVEDEEQVYKSMYIQSDNRLKVVDLKTNELMMNKEWTE